MINNYTVAAISTPIGIGAIGMIRITGSYSLSILKKIFISKQAQEEDIEHRKAYFGEIKDKQIVIDQAVATFFKAPNSFTGEDLVEITCHGGRFVMRKVLDMVIKNGARLAEPGEFTKRAFLNNKIDLIKAESIEDIIKAESELALLAAQKLLSGELSNKVGAFKNDLIELLSDIESEIEFPEEDDIVNNVRNKNKKRINFLTKIIARIKKLIDSFEQGVLLKEGFTVAIFGSPNTGKSTLLNKLIGYDRALVSNTPGTTRDYLREKIIIHGLPVSFIDMAGIRIGAKSIEKKGIEQCKNLLSESTIAIFLLDGSRKINKNDLFALNLCPKKISKIFVINKTDKNKKINLDVLNIKKNKPIFISALKEEGIDNLLHKVKAKLNQKHVPLKNEFSITHIRHKNALEICQNILIKSIADISDNKDVELLSYDLNEALKELRVLTGEISSSDIINNIFSNFCIGK